MAEGFSNEELCPGEDTLLSVCQRRGWAAFGTWCKGSLLAGVSSTVCAIFSPRAG